MNHQKSQALDAIDRNRELLCRVSDQLWEHPEVGFHEKYAAELYCDTLEALGFQVERNLAGIPTAFSGTYGNDGPVIGFLGEFDALPGLSQVEAALEKIPAQESAPGHGCGHNLLGVGSLAAAVAVKQYLQDNHLPGTVVFFGCPAEEGGSGKGFMARSGVFQQVDIAFSWHPGEVNSVSTEGTMSNYQICYHFRGVSAHAAMSPEQGRSALDALELMNIGVQFLREHVPTDTRIHYAITDTGGSAPGTVQPYAQAVYLLRAVHPQQLIDLYDRVNKIARGAAMMTDTTVEIEFSKAIGDGGQEHGQGRDGGDEPLGPPGQSGVVDRIGHQEGDDRGRHGRRGRHRKAVAKGREKSLPGHHRGIELPGKSALPHQGLAQQQEDGGGQEAHEQKGDDPENPLQLPIFPSHGAFPQTASPASCGRSPNRA